MKKTLTICSLICLLSAAGSVIPFSGAANQAPSAIQTESDLAALNAADDPSENSDYIDALNSTDVICEIIQQTYKREPLLAPSEQEPISTEAELTTAIVPETEGATTALPATEAPETEAATTAPVTTEAPKTETPTTAEPVTEAPVTEAPKTEPPVTETPKPADSDSKTYVEAMNYTDEDLLWMARIIYAESGGESIECQLAVGSVVLNRVASKSFPNTIYDVIFQPNQFTPARSGSIYKTPSATSYEAARRCLEGERVSTRILYFQTAKYSSGTWMARTRELVIKIGSENFYA